LRIKVINKKNDNLVLLIKGVSTPFVNALRRTILVEVPTMAIDEVVIIENSSILHDEIITHRLGLIPIITDLDSYNMPEECQCQSDFGCSLCRASFVLDAESNEDKRTVYSGELQSDNPNIIPINEKIPIVKLTKDQRIRFEAYARLGKGKKHAKWQPVSKCSYKYFPFINISEDCNICGKCVEICPRQVLKKNKEKIEISNLTACTLCKDCVKVCPLTPPTIDVKWKENEFIFMIESTGVLSPKKIMIEASKILGKQLNEFENLVKVNLKVEKS
jgi:DNA-directed RNA polymerase subunit D